MQKKTIKCLICGSRNIVDEIAIPFTQSLELQKFITIKTLKCLNCNFIYLPNNYYKYISLSNFPKKPEKRMRQGKKAGREYKMVQTAAEILNLKEKTNNALIFGAGINKDHLLTNNITGIKDTLITDLKNFTKSDKFIPIKTKQQFTIVIASEVIEHFINPLRDFKNIFNFLDHDGILICSTNINNNFQTINNHIYPFYKGHTSYYSAKSLAMIAKYYKLYYDFRIPKCAISEAGPRKRYVFFYKNPKIHNKIALYFGQNLYAYSE